MIENTSLPSDAEALGCGCCTPVVTPSKSLPTHWEENGRKWNTHVCSCSLMLCSLRFPSISSPRIVWTRGLNAVRLQTAREKGPVRDRLRDSKSPALVDGVPGNKTWQKKAQQSPACQPSSPSARSQLVRFRNSSIATVAGTFEREVIVS